MDITKNNIDYFNYLLSQKTNNAYDVKFYANFLYKTTVFKNNFDLSICLEELSKYKDNQFWLNDSKNFFIILQKELTAGNISIDNIKYFAYDKKLISGFIFYIKEFIKNNKLNSKLTKKLDDLNSAVDQLIRNYYLQKEHNK